MNYFNLVILVACELVDIVSSAILTTNHPDGTIFATIFNANSIPMLTMAPGNILYTSFPNVLDFDAPMKVRFSAIEAFFQYFNWERVNLLGFSTLNSYVSNFASFAYAREWLVGSNLVLDDASNDSLVTAFSVMKETGTKWVTEIYLIRYTFSFKESGL